MGLLTAESICIEEGGVRYYWKINLLRRKYHVNFHTKNQYHTNHKVMSGILIFQVKFNIEFMSQVVNFSGITQLLIYKKKTKASFLCVNVAALSAQKAIPNELLRLSGASELKSSQMHRTLFELHIVQTLVF